MVLMVLEGLIILGEKSVRRNEFLIEIGCGNLVIWFLNGVVPGG